MAFPTGRTRTLTNSGSIDAQCFQHRFDGPGVSGAIQVARPLAIATTPWGGTIQVSGVGGIGTALAGILLEIADGLGADDSDFVYMSGTTSPTDLYGDVSGNGDISISIDVEECFELYALPENDTLGFPASLDGDGSHTDGIPGVGVRYFERAKIGGTVAVSASLGSVSKSLSNTIASAVEIDITQRTQDTALIEGEWQGLPIGTGAFLSAIGEGSTAGSDVTDSGSLGFSSGAGFVPYCVTGRLSGSIPYSVAVMGDSIEAGSGTTGIAGVLTDKNGGGTSQYLYANGIAYSQFASGGEKAQNIANAGGWLTLWQIASLHTHVVDDLATNDFGNGALLPQVQIWRLQIAQRCALQGQVYIGKTILPTTQEGTSVAWTSTTTSTQIQQSWEASRVAFNTWWRSSSTAQTTVTSEAPSGTVNSSNKLFYPSQAMDTTQAVTVVVTTSGVPATKVYGTDYEWAPQLRAGKYVGGIQFVTAPATGSTVAISYKSLPGGLAAAGPLAQCWDACAFAEVNGSNVLTLNGGYCRAAGAQFANSTWSASVTTDNTLQTDTLTDSTQTWTPGALVGYVIRKGNPGSLTTAIGNSYIVLANTATTITTTSGTGFASGNAYTIYGPDGNGKTPYFRDGLHPTQQLHTIIGNTFPVSTFQIVAMNRPFDLTAMVAAVNYAFAA